MSAGNPSRIKAGAHGDGSYFHALETLMLAYINGWDVYWVHGTGFQPPTLRSVHLRSYPRGNFRIFALSTRALLRPMFAFVLSQETRQLSFD